MELYLIRHAQSQNNAKPEEDRVEDPSLTELGHEQAACLGKWIPALKLTKLITSPFLRTLQTAEQIHKATNLAPEVQTDLHELGGCYRGHIPGSITGRPGMSRTEIERQFPAFRVSAEIDGGGWWQSKPYETHELARQRAKTLLERTRDAYAHTEERIAYVMHADIKLIFLEQFHGEPLDCPYNVSVSKIQITPQACQLQDFNRVQHLPPHLIAR